MIKVRWQVPGSITDVQRLVQQAIDIEFATLPPYLYAKMTILPGSNAPAAARMNGIVQQEMIHMCLASNIMNAIGGTVGINPPRYPGPLPASVGGDLIVHLLPFSIAAMAQGMAIEEPSEPIDPPVLMAMVEAKMLDMSITIGEYYHLLDQALAALPASAWIPNRFQIDDSQFFPGQLFAVNNYDDAHKAITQIVSEGEGTPVSPGSQGSPLTFENELAHYYRFWEMERNQVLVKDPGNPVGYAWAGSLGLDYAAVYPAISDPELHDFSHDSPAAQQAQAECNAAYTAMVDALTAAFSGGTGGLGIAVRAMFDLRMAAIKALNTPLANRQVSGPAFLYTPITTSGVTP
ncbi:hypothetical protein C7S18_05435 [Ahniella affigens]|uniref:Iminophenyl-pyruvate dimer synthase domain-containing protein n=1 Tax=Ahniella affigens TaxID=2021234 RepID=A0A2P1PPB6_9GAMM|nr:ferritin-like protein [Ahniella affigens]AVP96679.1 hypothetical protein C7S18_05435 [Ahniella affigens]